MSENDFAKNAIASGLRGLFGIVTRAAEGAMDAALEEVEEKVRDLGSHVSGARERVKTKSVKRRAKYIDAQVIDIKKRA